MHTVFFSRYIRHTVNRREEALKLKEIGEFGFIKTIAHLGDIRKTGVIKGIGDDCAVMDVGGPEYLLVTTDLLVERVHFIRDWAGPEILGAKSLVVNISDIAACGGSPRDAFVSIAVPETTDFDWLQRFYAGMSECAKKWNVNLLGGDTTASMSDFVVNVALLGTVPNEQVLFRHTANIGDAICLTGPTGESAAGLELLLGKFTMPGDAAASLIRAHLEPQPHVLEGRMLAESGYCSAAIDVSDGISSDLGHLCEDSGLGAVIYEEKIQVTESLREAAENVGLDPLHWVMNGGEDYVLIAAVRPDGLNMLTAKFQAIGRKLLPIGKFVQGSGVELLKRDGSRQRVEPRGWNHFSA